MIILPIEKSISSVAGAIYFIQFSNWSWHYLGKDRALCCKKAWLNLILFLFLIPCRTSCLLILSSTAVVGSVRASVLKKSSIECDLFTELYIETTGKLKKYKCFQGTPFFLGVCLLKCSGLSCLLSHCNCPIWLLFPRCSQELILLSLRLNCASFQSCHWKCL